MAHEERSGKRAGLFRLGAYAFHALLSERIIQGVYIGNINFTATAPIVTLGSRFVSLFLTLIGGRTRSNQLNGPSVKVSIIHALIAIFTVLASLCQYEALRHLPFTTLAVAQCMVLVLLTPLPLRKAIGPLFFAAIGFVAYVYPRYRELLLDYYGLALVAGHVISESIATLLRTYALEDRTEEDFTGRITGEVVGTIAALLYALITGFQIRSETSLSLLWTSPSLVVHLILLSLIAGILVNIPPSAASRVVPIPLNAITFGTFDAVGTRGWTGIAYVAAAHWLQETEISTLTKSRSNVDFLPLSQEEDAYPIYTDVDEIKHLKHEATSTNARSALRGSDSKSLPTSLRYVIATFAPLVLSIVIHMEMGWKQSQETVIEGGLWAQQLHAATLPQCPSIAPDTLHYTGVGRGKTALATFPRSGNSYIRGLVERSTGYRTSSVYCDYALAPTFKDECNHNAYFLVKTHYPSVRVNVQRVNNNTHWEQFDQIVHLIRNPLDVIFSYYNVIRGNHDHTYRVPDLDKFGRTQRNEVLRHAANWAKHSRYWTNVPRRTFQIRYEDLRNAPLPNLMATLGFFMSDEDLPSLSQLACATELHVEAQAYKSRKVATFDSWDRYEDNLRNEVLQAVAPEWCRYGYDDIARAEGYKTGVDCSIVAESNDELLENGDPTGGTPNTRRTSFEDVSV